MIKLTYTAWQGWVRFGPVWLGKARRGMVWHGQVG